MERSANTRKSVLRLDFPAIFLRKRLVPVPGRATLRAKPRTTLPNIYIFSIRSEPRGIPPLRRVERRLSLSPDHRPSPVTRQRWVKFQAVQQDFWLRCTRLGPWGGSDARPDQASGDFLEHRVQCKGAVTPCLAIPAMAGIAGRQRIASDDVADHPVAAPFGDRHGHSLFLRMMNQR